MDNLMEDLLIDQEERIFEPVGKVSFSYIALKAEKVIKEDEYNENKN